MTIAEWLARSEGQLASAGVDAPRTDALVLLETILDRDRTWLLAHLDEEISSEELSALSPLLKRRLKREPLAYIVGFKEFYGLKLNVNSDVLIPRPETEALVEYVTEHAPKSGRVIDVGTGSGAIAIAIKHHRPDLSVLGTDVSQKVLDVAQNNSSDLQTNIKFVHSNLLDSVTGKFDIIAANLPYVPRDSTVEPELAAEPASALYVDGDGLGLYGLLLAQAYEHLEPVGQIVIEHDPQQLAGITSLAQRHRLSSIRSISPFVTILAQR